MRLSLLTNVVMLVLFSCQVLAMGNDDVTIHSKVFISEKTSSYFHRTFCSKVLTKPESISYIECKKHHFKPCKICCDRKLIERLDAEYEASIKENLKLAKEAQQKQLEQQRLLEEKRIQQQKLREEKRLAYAAEQQRKQQQREQKEKQRLELEEARWKKHQEDISKINDICQRVKVNFSIVNNSGFVLPTNLFRIDKRIRGSLQFPVQKGKVDVVPVIRCSDDSYVYHVSGDQKDSCLFPTYKIDQQITVIGRKFDAITRPITFVDGKVLVRIDGVNLERSNGYIYAFMTFENRTNDFLSIKDIYVSFDGVVCQAFSEELVLNSNISIPPKNKLTKVVVFNSLDSRYGLEGVIAKLKKSFTKAEMEHSVLNLSVSARYDRLGVDSDHNPFHGEKVVKYSELFGL